jgi:hypothetical protein
VRPRAQADGVGREDRLNAGRRDHRHQKATTVQCAECEISSGLYWQGWRAYRVDEPGTDEAPALAFYCPTCAYHQFGCSPHERQKP